MKNTESKILTGVASSVLNTEQGFKILDLTICFLNQTSFCLKLRKSLIGVRHSISCSLSSRQFLLFELNHKVINIYHYFLTAPGSYFTLA